MSLYSQLGFVASTLLADALDLCAAVIKVVSQLSLTPEGFPIAAIQRTGHRTRHADLSMGESII